MKQDRKNWHIAAICLTVIILGILFYFFTANIPTIIAFFQKVNDILRPIYYGTILTFLLAPVYNFLYQKLIERLPVKQEKLKKGLCNAISIFLSLSFAFWLIYMLLAMVIPELYDSIEGLIKSIPSDFQFSTPQWILDYFQEKPEVYANIGPYYEAAEAAINNFVNTEITPLLNSVDGFTSFAQTTLLPHLTGVVTGVSTFVVGVVGLFFDMIVAVIVSIYLLSCKNTFSAQAKKLSYAIFPITVADFLLSEVRNAYRILSGFINGKIIDSMIIGVICWIGCNMLQMPYSSLIATVIGVTNVIPYFGPFIGAIPCGILVFLVSPIKCLYFVGFIVALQQFDGNILGPKILGESTGLSSFWVLFAIILFGGIFGVVGMILGVPIFATFYSMVSRFIKYLLGRKNYPQETTSYEKEEWEKFKAHLEKENKLQGITKED